MTGRCGKKATPLCPCGYLGHRSGRCRCTPDQVARYRGKLSGPLLDRIDIQVEVPSLRDEELFSQSRGESSAVVRGRVERARRLQLERQGSSNSQLAMRILDQHCNASEKSLALLKQAITRLDLSARAHFRVLKLARTIADLDDSTTVEPAHIAEAIQYRRLQIGM